VVLPVLREREEDVTVGELIEELSKYHSNLPVLVSDYTWDDCPVSRVELQSRVPWDQPDIRQYVLIA